MLQEREEAEEEVGARLRLGRGTRERNRRNMRSMRRRRTTACNSSYCHRCRQFTLSLLAAPVQYAPALRLIRFLVFPSFGDEQNEKQDHDM
eukprot:3698064-Pyramimonas_sp.AAC.1